MVIIIYNYNEGENMTITNLLIVLLACITTIYILNIIGKTILVPTIDKRNEFPYDISTPISKLQDIIHSNYRFLAPYFAEHFDGKYIIRENGRFVKENKLMIITEEFFDKDFKFIKRSFRVVIDGYDVTKHPHFNKLIL